MSKRIEAFARYGITLCNNRWSWSGINDDGEVAVMLWEDQFDYSATPVSYSNFGNPVLLKWKNRCGNKERIRLLKHAMEKNDGRFRVVHAAAIDVNADPRKIDASTVNPRPNMIMRLVELNEQTGEFSAVEV